MNGRERSRCLIALRVPAASAKTRFTDAIVRESIHFARDSPASRRTAGRGLRNRVTAIVKNGTQPRNTGQIAPRTTGVRCLQSLRFVLAATIAAQAIFAVPGAAQGGTTVTESVGGTGGGPFRLSCPSGMVMVGINGRHGAWVDALAPICAIWVRSNRTLGEIDEQSGTGGTGGGRGWMRCEGPRGAVVGLSVWPVNRDNRRLVGRILLECGDYERPEQHANNLPRGALAFGESFERERVELRCGAREVAVGLYGRSGAFIDRVGLLCERSRALAQR
jgi:hypothetical protein